MHRCLAKRVAWVPAPLSTHLGLPLRLLRGATLMCPRDGALTKSLAILFGLAELQKDGTWQMELGPGFLEFQHHFKLFQLTFIDRVTALRECQFRILRNPPLLKIVFRNFMGLRATLVFTTFLLTSTIADRKCNLDDEQCNQEESRLRIPTNPCPEEVDGELMTMPLHPCFLDPQRARACCDTTGFTPVLMHIPKTGGKSLNYLMKYLYHNDWRRHFFYHHPPDPYGSVVSNPILHKHIHAGCPLVMVTVLRNPTSRVVSEWFHYGQAQFVRKPPVNLPCAPDVFKAKNFDLSSGSAARAIQLVFQFLYQYPWRAPPFFGSRDLDEQSQEFMQSQVSLLFGELQKMRSTQRYWDFMEAYVSHPATANLQVKYLLGHQMYSVANVTQKDVDTLMEMTTCFHSQRSDCRTIQQPQLLAGTLEHYNATLEHFAKHLQWDLEPEIYKKDTSEDGFLKRVPGRIKVDEIPSQIIQAIQQNNQIDQMLYDRVSALFKAAPVLPAGY